MELKELLKYKEIVIQCHDNPDADAIASGYALWRYLKWKNIDSRFVYSGRFPIQKSNLVMMIEMFDVPVEFVNSIDECELLVTVDCRYGEGNVTKLPARNVAVIDHHQVSGEAPEFSEIRSNIGACSTILWKLMKDEGFSFADDTNLQTALYYGLMTDTNNFSELSHPLDRDMRDELNIIRSNITLLRNSNLSLEELKIAGEALEGSIYNEKYHYGVVSAKPCDPNILGVISDMMLEVYRVDTCLVYSILEFGVKLSLRSCIKEAKASELAEYVSEGIGSGGGHLEKAGGFIKRDLLEGAGVTYTPEDVFKFLDGRMNDYFRTSEIVYAGKYVMDVSKCGTYKKLNIKLGYVDPKDVGIIGETTFVRTMDGDLDVTFSDDSYIMIGVEGEIYPIKKKKFEDRNEYLTEDYVFVGEYEPTLKDTKTGRSISIIPYAKSCLSKGDGVVYAQKLDHRVKVFTAWDLEKYYLGKPGDYLVCREDDLSDVYIVNGRIFEMTYETCTAK